MGVRQIGADDFIGGITACLFAGAVKPRDDAGVIDDHRESSGNIQDRIGEVSLLNQLVFRVLEVGDVANRSKQHVWLAVELNDIRIEQHGYRRTVFMPELRFKIPDAAKMSR
ncbi:hypothetical protein SDC9_94819 [bioreactor metagenome]|uniref:Uncharacterized protein n=1 Tax=bioreactor metagenome TaxID=1076179 RepID=A0A645A4U4_9ZZZZ